jgi:G3E family GTPase
VNPLGISVVSGFLGSGKTTLLNALLKDARLRDTAIVVNEFGEIGLDHLIVAQGKEDVVLLDSGCLCCTISETLNQTLEDLYWRRDRGEIPTFRRVIVETTGLADPGPILRMLLRDYFVSKHFSINGVLSVADGLLGRQQLLEHEEAVNQIAFADLVAISKVDLADRAQIEALRQALSRLNRSVAIVEGGRSPDGDVLAEIIEFFLRDPARKWPEATQKPHAHDHEHASHHASIEAHAFYLSGPISWQDYASWLDGLRALPAADLLRVKGLVEIEQAGRPYLIQGVQHIFSTPNRLEAWPTDDRRNRLVTITRGVQKARLDAIFGANIRLERNH